MLFIERPVIPEIQNPCIPSPCGVFSICRVIENRPVCSCEENYFGQPPNCRPECTVNSECAQTKACVNQKCRDPCPGSCGYNAECRTINHTPVCYCLPGFSGDPFSGCKECKEKILVLFTTDITILNSFQLNQLKNHLTLVILLLVAPMPFVKS